MKKGVLHKIHRKTPVPFTEAHLMYPIHLVNFFFRVFEIPTIRNVIVTFVYTNLTHFTSWFSDVFRGYTRRLMA